MELLKRTYQWLLSRRPDHDEKGNAKQRWYFFTGFRDKAARVEHYLNLAPGTIRCLHIRDLPTLEDIQDPKYLAQYRVQRAKEYLDRHGYPPGHILLEETALQLCTPGKKRMFGTYFSRLLTCFGGHAVKALQAFSGEEEPKVKITVAVGHWHPGLQTAHAYTDSMYAHMQYAGTDKENIALKTMGWDAVLRPLGHDQTIAECAASQRYVIDVRQQAYMKMLNALQLRHDNGGLFEIHVTVVPKLTPGFLNTKQPDVAPYDVDSQYEAVQSGWRRFVKTCQAQKPMLHIRPLCILEAGEACKEGWWPQVQFQTAEYVFEKDVHMAFMRAKDKTAKPLMQAGFHIARIRVEAMPGNSVTPKSKLDVAIVESKNPIKPYWEYHCRLTRLPKLLLPMIRRHQTDIFQLSVSEKPGQKFYLNARGYSMCNDEMQDAWNRLCHDIGHEFFHHDKPPIREYAIYDNKPSMDVDRASPCVVTPSLWQKIRQQGLEEE